MPKQKAASVGARRRLKKLAKSRRPDITLPGGEAVVTPLRGRDRRGTQTEEDPMRTVRNARIRHGATPDEAMAPLCGEPIGMCIADLVTDPAERTALWQTWCALSAARRNYRARIIGQTGEPKNAAIAMLPDEMQTDQSPRVDLRDPDAKDADAIAAWERWEARLKRITPPQLVWALRDPLDHMAGTLWQDGAATPRGRNAVTALRRLVEQEGS